ncbi:hypothetical protein ACQZV8_05870 [Magnetococcales bacterium HHB-1]
MHIGIDLDNTLISYEGLFHQAGFNRGWLTSPSDSLEVLGKTKVRNQLRAQREGERKWRRVQADVYGRLIRQARCMEYVRPFLTRCQKKNIPISIISHKTQFATEDQDHVDLRQMALSWLTDKGFFSLNSTYDSNRPITRHEHVFFADTRAEKLQLIAQQKCTHFIDDLIEVLTDPAFPEQVQRFWLLPEQDDPELLNRLQDQDLKVCRSWQEVDRAIFADA